jgi:hypothetical protein
MDTAELTTMTRFVADQRRGYAEAKAALAAAHADFEATHRPLFDAVKIAGSTLDMVEKSLKADVLRFHTEQPAAPLPPGVSIRNFAKLDYDPDAAFAWAQEKNMAITPACLDVKAFESIAKATPLPFVTALTTPTVALAKDLDAALAEVAS